MDILEYLEHYLNHYHLPYVNRKRCGRPPKLSFKNKLSWIIRIVKLGLAWRDLKDFLPYLHFTTIYKFFSKLKDQNFFENAYNHLILQMFMDDSLKLKILSLDTTNINVGPCSTDRGRKGSKISAVTDELGTVLSFCFAPGNESDSFIGIHNLKNIPVPIYEPKLLVDKGYFGKPFELAVQKLGNQIQVICPHKHWEKNRVIKRNPKCKTIKYKPIKRETICVNGICQDFSIIKAKKQFTTFYDANNELLKKRHVVENAILYLKSYKRIPRRYDKSMESFKSCCYIAELNILYPKYMK